MGRQWLHAKRLAAGLKKGRTNQKLVREITVAAKMGGGDPNMNPRLFAALEKARKESVTRDTIERAIKKGSGTGDEKLVLDHMIFEGYAPFKVPVIVEAYTDNSTRTAPEIRMLFRDGQLGTTGSNKFLFDHVGLVDAFHSDPEVDREAAAIEAGANEFKIISPEQNDDIPEGTAGTRFICERTDVHVVSKWLSQNAWTVVAAEQGYLPKQIPTLNDEQKSKVAEFLQELDDHDDVQRVWAAFE